MSTTKPAVVKMAKQFNQSELEQRQQEARSKIIGGYYQPSEYGAGRWIFPAQEVFSFTGFEPVITFVAEIAATGRKLYEHDKPVFQGNYFSVSFYRSDEELEQLFNESDAQVAVEYQAELDQHNQQQIDLLTQQLYQQAKAKEEKVIADKEAKALATARADAEKFIKQQLEGAK